MKIIITGGAGFIGSHIGDAYLKSGHKIIVIDNLSTGSKSNIDKKTKFYRADITNLSAINRIFKKERPEAVSHHAAIAAVSESLKNPDKIFRVNTEGTKNIIRSFSQYRKGNGKFIFASSAAIYGNSKKMPLEETDPPNPISAYGLSKLLSEEIVKFFSHTQKIEAIIFRYANVYGPRQKPIGEAGVIPIFIKLMKSKKRPKIFGGGSNTRDYVYVEDIVSANLRALKIKKSEVINIGLGKEITDREIYRKVADSLNFKSAPRFAPKREGDIARNALSSGKAELLGWRPKIKLEEGIIKTAKAFN